MSIPVREYPRHHEVTENYERGLSYMEDDRLEEALETLLAEPDDSPCFGLARGNAAMVLLRRGRFQEAEAIADETLSFLDTHGCPHPPSWVQFVRHYAEALVGQGRYEESLKAFNGARNLADRLIKEQPDFALDLELEKAHAFNSWGSALNYLERFNAAIDIFHAARKIYSKHRGVNRVGVAETLTNYAHALRLTNKQTAAELALMEAQSIAVEGGHQDQVRRIKLALIQLDSPSIKKDEADAFLWAAAAKAEEAQQFSVAYVRRCIHAEFAATHDDTAVGLAIVAAARKLEARLDPNDPNPAKLRMTWSRLLEQDGRADEDVVGVLIEGASLWFERIGRPLKDADFWTMTAAMHEHFRMLADYLIRLNRIEESVAAFEAGRALAHAVEVDNRFFERVIKNNPFSLRNVSVDLGLLQAARDSIGHNDALVILAVLPPNLVAYVIGKTGIDVAHVPMPERIEDREQLFTDIRMIPLRLQERRAGGTAIPGEARSLAEKVQRLLSGRVVRALMPHSHLHDIPWRAVLRDVGLEWKQLPCGVEFGLFLRSGSLEPCRPGACVALGSGTAGRDASSVDLREEARAFAQSFGADSRVIVNCTTGDVASALRSADTVLISCHGSQDRDGRLVLELANGSHVADDVFPEVVHAKLIMLSACESGVYQMAWSDFPVGAAPLLLRTGARFVIGARFRVDATFAASFFPKVAELLAAGHLIGQAVAEASAACEAAGADLWRDLACLELLGGP